MNVVAMLEGIQDDDRVLTKRHSLFQQDFNCRVRNLTAVEFLTAISNVKISGKLIKMGEYLKDDRLERFVTLIT
jgi:hypothetical protein